MFDDCKRQIICHSILFFWSSVCYRVRCRLQCCHHWFYGLRTNRIPVMWILNVTVNIFTASTVRFVSIRYHTVKKNTFFNCSSSRHSCHSIHLLPFHTSTQYVSFITISLRCINRATIKCNTIGKNEKEKKIMFSRLAFWTHRSLFQIVPLTGYHDGDAIRRKMRSNLSRFQVRCQSIRFPPDYVGSSQIESIGM